MDFKSKTGTGTHTRGVCEKKKIHPPTKDPSLPHTNVSLCTAPARHSWQRWLLLSDVTAERIPNEAANLQPGQLSSFLSEWLRKNPLLFKARSLSSNCKSRRVVQKQYEFWDSLRRFFCGRAVMLPSSPPWVMLVSIWRAQRSGPTPQGVTQHLLLC